MLSKSKHGAIFPQIDTENRITSCFMERQVQVGLIFLGAASSSMLIRSLDVILKLLWFMWL